MDWLWIILRYLFPLDTVRQCIEAARDRIALMVNYVFTDETLAEFAQDAAARLHLEAIIIDYEASLRMAITARACQIARRRFKPRAQVFYKPTRAKPLEQLLARIHQLVAIANDIERLAQREAIRLQRERDADPLATYAPAHLSAQAHLRSSRRTRGSRADITSCSDLQLQSRARSATVPGSRRSSGRAAVCLAQALARGPPHPPDCRLPTAHRLAATCEVATR